MSAVHVLRPWRRGVAPLAVCVCLAAVPAAAWRDTGEPRPSDAAHYGARVGIVLAQAGGAPVSPYEEPAPNLFEATGTALWDGKRTLQGVWVAHPLAKSARRVRIYNAETGVAVDGALFKRDPALSGPSVLVSSEVARFLGMTPGDEVGLRIVALTPSQKPVTQPVPAPAEQAAATPPADAPALPAETTPAEPPAAAAQPQDEPPIERTEPTTAPAEPVTAMAVPMPRPDRPTETTATETTATETTATETTATETTATETVAAPAWKRPPSSPQPAPEATGRSARASASTLATEIAAQATPKETATVRPLFQTAPPGDFAVGSADEPSATVAAVTIAGPTPEPTPEPTADASAPSPFRPVFQPAPRGAASEALAVAPSLLSADWPADTLAVAPTATAPETSSVQAAAPASEPVARLSAVEPESAPALPMRPTAASTLTHPYVQAGIFGVAENADRLLGRLKEANLPALGKPMQLNGRPATRVLAGPFAAAAERDAAVRTIRGMGLRDAAPVAR